jgi:hypothetical protein
MTETRPEMTHAQFAAAAGFAHEHWWLTGEDAFLHVPAVMEVEGWNIYGHLGHYRLTEPQRVLMMWSDLVGQTSNGGFTQFIDNYESALELAHPLIEKLGWPELFERFDRAFREQAGDPRNPQPKRDPWGSETDDWPANRQRIILHLAEKHSRWRPWARQREIATFERMTDTILNTWYNQAVESGDLAPSPERISDFEPVPTEAAQAFDDWFYRDETKAESRIFVGDYIMRHRDDLCRLTD